MSYSGSLIIGPILYAFGFSIHEIIPLLYTISMMESKSLFIVDDSPDNRLETARQQGASNGLVFLNKFEGAQMEHDRRICMTASAKNQIRMPESREITTETAAQVQSDRIAQQKRAYRNRKRQNDSDESRQAELDAECQPKAKSRRLAKDKLDIENIKEREALFEKVNQRYPSILSVLIAFRIHEFDVQFADAQFADLQFHEQQFPQSPRYPKRLYKNYVKRTYESKIVALPILYNVKQRRFLSFFYLSTSTFSFHQ